MPPAAPLVAQSHGCLQLTQLQLRMILLVLRLCDAILLYSDYLTSEQRGHVRSARRQPCCQDLHTLIRNQKRVLKLPPVCI